jgi:hypothetical protein
MLATMLKDSLEDKSVPVTGTPGTEAFSSQTFTTARSMEPACTGTLTA